jgi:hypothetical protein
VLHEHPRRARRLERERAGEHLVGDDAERVLVAAAVDGALAERLLGAHVRRRPHGHAGDGEALVLLRRAGDAEVGDEGAPALPVEEHVVGLHVAVHHAVRVGVGERVGHLGDEAARLGVRQPPSRVRRSPSVSPST